MSDDVANSLGQIRDALAALNGSLAQLVKLLGPQVVVDPPKSVRVRSDRKTQGREHDWRWDKRNPLGNPNICGACGATANGFNSYEANCPGRPGRQTQSYSQVDPSGLSKPSTACRHSGCLTTADGYCDEHKGQG